MLNGQQQQQILRKARHQHTHRLQHRQQRRRLHLQRKRKRLSSYKSTQPSQSKSNHLTSPTTPIKPQIIQKQVLQNKNNKTTFKKTKVYVPLQQKILGQSIHRIEQWMKTRPSHMLVLYGKCGTGKTHGALAIANHYGFRKAILNCSEQRNVSDLKLSLCTSTTSKGFNQKRPLLILDEIDGLHEDAVEYMCKFFKHTPVKQMIPVIATCNEWHLPHLRALRTYSTNINFHRVFMKDMMTLAQRLQPSWSRAKLQNYCLMSHGDLRQLKLLCGKKTTRTTKADPHTSIFDVLSRLFSHGSLSDHDFHVLEASGHFYQKLIFDNYLRHIKHSKQLDNMVQMSNLCSILDMYQGQLMVNYHLTWVDISIKTIRFISGGSTSFGTTSVKQLFPDNNTLPRLCCIINTTYNTTCKTCKPRY